MTELPVFSQENEFTFPNPAFVEKWAGKESNVLILNYTLACALACDFCCYGCHPNRAEKMPVTLAINLVEQAADLGVFSSVGFTGGEPMLFLDELLEIGDVLRKRGLPFTIATAAHWATSPAEARRIIALLAERGLCRLNLSSDQSHEKFVAAENVTHAALAAHEYGIPVIVTGVFYSTEDKLEQRMPLLADREDILLLNKCVNKVGRANKADVTQERFGLQLGLENYRCYRKQYHDVVVFYDGKTYPCCSTFNRATPGIMVGNAMQESLKTLWERIDDSEMLRVMKREGFAHLYEIIEEFDRDLYRELPKAADSVGACHLCNLIFKNPRITPRVRVVFEKYQEQIVDRSIDSLVKLLGGEQAESVMDQLLAS